MTIECEKFYSLMQAYRHAPVTDQKAVKDAYEAVKRYIEGYTQQAIDADRMDD